ncbi:hypothetical protein ACQ4PT_062104 [Festuca glaucescens]
MVVYSVGGCAEGRAALMDTGAVAAVSSILLSGAHDTDARVAELKEWCVAAIYALSRGSLQWRQTGHSDVACITSIGRR